MIHIQIKLVSCTVLEKMIWTRTKRKRDQAQLRDTMIGWDVAGWSGQGGESPEQSSDKKKLLELCR